jgi:hypothetical protein
MGLCTPATAQKESVDDLAVLFRRTECLSFTLVVALQLDSNATHAATPRSARQQCLRTQAGIEAVVLDRIRR